MKAALVGNGIGPSLTPPMHEAEGKAQGFSYSYARWDTAGPPWQGMPLAAILDHAEAEGFAGLNVTHPHKTTVTAYLDVLHGPAKDLGTVNTVLFKDGRRIGHTTDYTGFRRAILDAEVPLAGQSIVQFGAGGAGAAVALALLDEKANLMLIDTDVKRAQDLGARLKQVRPAANITARSFDNVDLKHAAGAVNATPLGMAAYPGMAFDPADLPLAAWIADIVYVPRETALLRAARARGNQSVDGGGMAVQQAVAAFELITGRPADPQRMTESFHQATA